MDYVFIMHFIWNYAYKNSKIDVNKGGLIFRKVLLTLNLVETRHKLIWHANNTIRNLAIAAPRLLWLSTDVTRFDLAKKAKSFAYE